MEVEAPLQHMDIPKKSHNTSAGSMSALPSPEQAWVHAVDSRRSLLNALKDDNITAVETDLVMGKCVGGNSTKTAFAMSNGSTDERIPIMAHPPNTESDLSMTDFMALIADPENYSNGNEASSSSPTRTVTKVIKLDFKQMETVEPTLKAIFESQIQTTDSSAFVLNADILPGPGQRDKGPVAMEATQFLDTCMRYIVSSRQQSTHTTTTRFAFSLGFSTDYKDTIGYTADDVAAMADIIGLYKLTEQQDLGVVLALNARLLHLSLSNFDDILTQYPDLQILVWSGKGEPPIPQSLFQDIKDYYQQAGMGQRIGFDCQIQQG